MSIPRPRKLRNGAQPFRRHVPGIDYGVLDELGGYAVRRAQIAIYEDIERVLGPLKITPPRFSSLVLIDRNPGVLQSELAAIIGVGAPAMVAIIDFLESQHWLRRQAHGADRRANHLVITPDGHALLERAIGLMRDLERRWTTRLQPDELGRLIGLLDRFGPAPDATPVAVPGDGS